MMAGSRPARHYDTIVVGAGMAGLACASRLFKHQFYQRPNALLVLEARDRIGGRINSVLVNGTRCDTGANWIHGTGTPDAPNPLMHILPHKRYKELSGTAIFEAPGMHDSRVVRSDNVHQEDANGWVAVDEFQDPAETPSKLKDSSRVVPAHVAGPMTSALWSSIESLHTLATSTPHDAAKSTTMLSALVKTDDFSAAQREIPERYRATLGGMFQFIENMEAGPLVAQSAEQHEGQAGMGLLEYAIDDFDGAQVFLQDGYTAITDEIAKALLAANLVELNREVRQIRWDEDPITIETSDASYTAKHVVCTVPLGVLQHALRSKHSENAQPCRLFHPRFPHQSAIESMGFGTLDKIFMIYSTAWWETQPYAAILKNGLVRRPSESESSPKPKDGIPDSFAGFTLDLPGFSLGPDGAVSAGPRHISVMNLANLTGAPALMTFVSCSMATRVERMSNDQVGAIIHAALSDWFGRETPQPTAIHVTRWSNDPFSRGSYSHMIAGLSETAHREAFSHEITNDHGCTLGFAGEHTSRDHFATVHGALLSGWREADRLLAGVGAA